MKNSSLLKKKIASPSKEMQKSTISWPFLYIILIDFIYGKNNHHLVSEISTKIRVVPVKNRLFFA